MGRAIYALIIPLLADFYKPKRADLLRQLFNFWTNSGNLAKISKRRFRDKLRAYDAPVVVLVYHIAIFSLKITWFRNKSIFHSISPLYYFIMPIMANHRRVNRTRASRSKGASHGKNGRYTALCYFTYNKSLPELPRILSFYHLRGDILNRIRHQTTTKQAIQQA